MILRYNSSSINPNKSNKKRKEIKNIKVNTQIKVKHHQICPSIFPALISQQCVYLSHISAMCISLSITHHPRWYKITHSLTQPHARPLTDSSTHTHTHPHAHAGTLTHKSTADISFLNVESGPKDFKNANLISSANPSLFLRPILRRRFASASADVPVPAAAAEED